MSLAGSEVFAAHSSALPSAATASSNFFCRMSEMPSAVCALMASWKSLAAFGSPSAAIARRRSPSAITGRGAVKVASFAEALDLLAERDPRRGLVAHRRGLHLALLLLPALLRLVAALPRGELVGMLGDRDLDLQPAGLREEELPRSALVLLLLESG